MQMMPVFKKKVMATFLINVGDMTGMGGKIWIIIHFDQFSFKKDFLFQYNCLPRFYEYAILKK